MSTTRDNSYDAEAQSAFLEVSGLRVISVTSTRVEGYLEVGAAHHTPYGIVHGGLYATTVETAASIGACAAVESVGMVAVGLTNVTDFLRPIGYGRIEVVATAVTQGRTQQLWRVTMTQTSNGKMVAVGQLRLQNVRADSIRREETSLPVSPPESEVEGLLGGTLASDEQEPREG